MSHIVLVEDDQILRYAVLRGLQKGGYEVAAFESTLHAWDYVGHGGDPAALITDIVFPAGQPTGIALARSARYHHPSAPIILMTAFDNAADFARHNLAGAARVLRKPLELSLLVEVMRDLLRNAC